MDAILGTDMSKHFQMCEVIDLLIKKIKDGKYTHLPEDRSVSLFLLLISTIADYQCNDSRS